MENAAFWLLFAMAIYTLVSTLIFEQVNKTATMVVDEQFHLPLGRAFCEYKLELWDPQVTTLPGLYMLSTSILGPFNACSIWNLRSISLGASIVNIPLMYQLLSQNNDDYKYTILTSVGLAFLPPLYFFSHLYYTDVASVSSVLLMFNFYDVQAHYIAGMAGLLAITCRQTNLVWVVYSLGRFVLTELHHILSHSDEDVPRHLPLRNLHIFRQLTTQSVGESLEQLTVNFKAGFAGYFTTIITFILFAYSNGGFVVGDKDAHEACIHFPQLFYFSLFCLVFAWPHFVGKVSNFLKCLYNNKLATFVVFSICMLTVYFNTLEHPYLLADNRHYTFYIWNRFYKYQIFRYMVIPVYMFAWYAMFKLIYDEEDISKIIGFICAVVWVLVPQKLIDVRYFFLPYIVFRMHIKTNDYTFVKVSFEIFTYIILNAITFYIFFTKQVKWDTFRDPQRIIW